MPDIYELCLHIVKIIRAVNRAEPGRAEPSEKKYTAAPAAASLREYGSTADTNEKTL